MPTSPHFGDSELACRHCGINGARPSLVMALEELRRRVSTVRCRDTPVLVNDAYRCPVHNAAVGGAKNSQHVEGIAADVRVTGWTAAQLLEVVKTVPGVTAYGRADYQGYVHFDLRHQPARWCYDRHGKESAWVDAVPSDSIVAA